MSGCLQGVAKNFREIFSELVPGGKSELVMQKRLQPEVDEERQQDDNDDEAAGDAGQNVSEKYSGVKVKVRLLYKEQAWSHRDSLR